MNADELLELVAYLVEENQRLKNQAKRLIKAKLYENHHEL
jgi:hypothetical protein